MMIMIPGGENLNWFLLKKKTEKNTRIINLSKHKGMGAVRVIGVLIRCRYLLRPKKALGVLWDLKSQELLFQMRLRSSEYTL
jgi:hypothetical protein